MSGVLQVWSTGSPQLCSITCTFSPPQLVLLLLWLARWRLVLWFFLLHSVFLWVILMVCFLHFLKDSYIHSHAKTIHLLDSTAAVMEYHPSAHTSRGSSRGSTQPRLWTITKAQGGWSHPGGTAESPRGMCISSRLWFWVQAQHPPVQPCRMTSSRHTRETTGSTQPC